MARRLTFGGMALAMLVCGACEGERSGPATPAPRAGASQPAPAPPPPAPPPGSGSITDEVTGDYDLTLDVGSACSVIHDSERTRRYKATIASPSEGKYVVTLTSGKFLEGRICDNGTGLGCNQFAADRTGDLIRFDLANNNDDGFGGHIVEQFASGPWVEIIGSAVGPVNGSTIHASGTSRIYYCPFQPPGTPCCQTPGPPGVPCPVASSGCQSADMTLGLTRR